MIRGKYYLPAAVADIIYYSSSHPSNDDDKVHSAERGSRPSEEINLDSNITAKQEALHGPILTWVGDGRVADPYPGLRILSPTSLRMK